MRPKATAVRSRMMVTNPSREVTVQLRLPAPGPFRHWRLARVRSGYSVVARPSSPAAAIAVQVRGLMASTPDPLSAQVAMDVLYKLACTLFHPLGLHLSRWHPSRDEAFRVLGLIREQGIDTVIDVGANTGQFAHSMISQGFTGRIYSFEPQAAIHRQLQDQARRHPSWTVAERCALGDQPGELDLNLSQNTYSSSFLPINPLNLQAAPRTAYVGQERVPVLRLDDWAQRYGISGQLLLKIDTQGFELKVLRGAQGLLPLIQGVLVECSLTPLTTVSHCFRRSWTSCMKPISRSSTSCQDCVIPAAVGSWVSTCWRGAKRRARGGMPASPGLRHHQALFTRAPSNDDGSALLVEAVR